MEIEKQIMILEEISNYGIDIDHLYISARYSSLLHTSYKIMSDFRKCDSTSSTSAFQIIHDSLVNNILDEVMFQHFVVDSIEDLESLMSMLQNGIKEFGDKGTISFYKFGSSPNVKSTNKAKLSHRDKKDILFLEDEESASGVSKNNNEDIDDDNNIEK